MTNQTKTVAAVRAERLRCAKAVCPGCATYGEPVRNDGRLPDVNGGTVSTRSAHQVKRGKYVACKAGGIWNG